MKVVRDLAMLAGVCALGACCPLSGEKPPPPPPRKVVLVHGIFETGKAFKPLKKRLEKEGMECYVPRLKHPDGRGGLDQLAVSLKSDIEKRFGPDAPIAVVGFSMGGLVSRHYLQALGGAERCTTFITISSPHHGTAAAHLYPSEGARQMRPGSDFLADLARTEERLGTVPVVSYRTPMDLVILPPSSSEWRRAQNREYPVLLHPMMLTSQPVIEDVVKQLLAAVPSSSENAGAVQATASPTTSLTRPAMMSARFASPSERRKSQ